MKEATRRKSNDSRRISRYRHCVPRSSSRTLLLIIYSIAGFLLCILLIQLWEFQEMGGGNSGMFFVPPPSLPAATFSTIDQGKGSTTGSARSSQSPFRSSIGSHHHHHRIQYFDSGSFLNVEPTLEGQCVSVRFRGDPIRNYTVDQAVRILQTTAAHNASNGTSTTSNKIDLPHTTTLIVPTLSIGVVFREDCENFFCPLSSKRQSRHDSISVYHFYHYLETLIVAYAELHRLARAMSPSADSLEATLHDRVDEPKNTSTPNQGSSLTALISIEVPWLYAPHMTASEFCSTPTTNLNCVLADMVFPSPRTRDDTATDSSASSFPFADHSRVIGRQDRRAFDSNNTAATERLFQEANAILLVERPGCPHMGINKMWPAYIDTFPADDWHAGIKNGLARYMATWPLERQRPSRLQQKWSWWRGWTTPARVPTYKAVDGHKVVVCYVDRQVTSRRLHRKHHEWILAFLSSHREYKSRVLFWHLKMEQYESGQQLTIASRCNVLMGVHGNGLSHALFMPPRQTVIEFFWGFPFMYDYATTAQLLQHSYLAVSNGVVLNRAAVAARDPALFKYQSNATLAESIQAFEREAKPAILKLIGEAIRQKQSALRVTDMSLKL